MAVVLGLLVAVTYGVGDFFGGFASKRNTPTVVVALSQAFGLLIMVLLVVLDGRGPVWEDVGFGAAAGSVGLIGVILLYRGLANGTMSVVAPITAVGAGVVPFAWGLLTGERPTAVALLGVGAALAAVALVSAADAVEDRTATRSDVLLALGAGTAFGCVFILLGETGEDSGMWPVLGARVASVSLVVTALVVTRGVARPAPGSLPSIAAAGALDAGANALYLLASREGLLSLVSVLSSLYPAATIVLARVVLHERMNTKQLAGIALALTGVGLIAAG
ncbi:MAG TPA: DMT family transporter [Acidimicrobiales bacterium]|nr:DMT family transporter [Acidimicrobiales bacterium]